MKQAASSTLVEGQQIPEQGLISAEARRSFCWSAVCRCCIRAFWRAAVFLPFLPMLPTQILLNNFLYALSRNLLHDNVV